MKILYIHQYFVTPDEPGATRSYWISQELIRRGHQVTVITSNSESHHLPGKFTRDGINVIYIKNDYDNYMSSIRKVYSFVKFIFQAINSALKEKNIDIVFATSTPLTIGAIALTLKLLKGWNYIFEVRDLWPEFPIQVGAIRNKVLIWCLRKFEKTIYRYSNHIIALSPGMRDGVIAAGTPISKCSVVPNMSKPDIFYPHKPSVEIADKFGIDMSKFNVIHFGMMGIANGLDYIIEAAIELHNMGVDNISFIFMGDGATLPALKNMVIENELKNVKFLGNHKLSVVAEVTNCCNASITSFKNLPILYTNSPNKLFDSLSAGKPIIVNSAGWTKDLVENEDCGFYVDPENPKMLAEKLIEVINDYEKLKLWGENARRLSIETFDKSKLSAQVADIIEKNS